MSRGERDDVSDAGGVRDLVSGETVVARRALLPGGGGVRRVVDWPLGGGVTRNDDGVERSVVDGDAQLHWAFYDVIVNESQRVAVVTGGQAGARGITVAIVTVQIVLIRLRLATIVVVINKPCCYGSTVVSSW